MKTINFSSEIGIHEGYNVDTNGKETTGIEAIAKLLKEAQSKIQEETGIYVSTIVKGPNRTCYNTDRGCPEGGAVTYTISSTANPEFAPDLNKWKEAALRLMNEMRTVLRQTTVSVEFHEPDGTDFYYLNSDRAINECLLEKYKILDSEGKSVFDKGQMKLIQEGLEKGLDVSKFTILNSEGKPVFNYDQMCEILRGLESGVDVSQYTVLNSDGKPVYEWRQMWEIREGLEAGVDVSQYTILNSEGKPEYECLQMREIREDLERKQYMTLNSKEKPIFNDEQIQEIQGKLEEDLKDQKDTSVSKEDEEMSL